MSTPATYIIGPSGTVNAVCLGCNDVMPLWGSKPIRIGKLIKTQVVELVKDEFTGSYTEVAVIKYVPRVKTVDGCPSCQDMMSDLQRLENKRQAIYARHGMSTNPRQVFIKVDKLPATYKPVEYRFISQPISGRRPYSNVNTRESLLSDLLSIYIPLLPTNSIDRAYENFKAAGHMAINILGWRDSNHPSYIARSL